MARSEHYATVGDTTWPVNLGGVEWVLRYAEPDRRQRLIAASVIAAYRHLTDPAVTWVDAEAKLRRAREAAREAARGDSHGETEKT